MKTIIKSVWLKFFVILCVAQIGSGAAMAQSTTTIKGTVTDAKTGETLPFVSILIPGTTMGTASDSEGRYAMTLRENHPTIKFTYVGYLSVKNRLNRYKPGDQHENVGRRFDVERGDH
jgi:hypothetical protein